MNTLFLRPTQPTDLLIIDTTTPYFHECIFIARRVKLLDPVFKHYVKLEPDHCRNRAYYKIFPCETHRAPCCSYVWKPKGPPRGHYIHPQLYHIIQKYFNMSHNIYALFSAWTNKPQLPSLQGLNTAFKTVDFSLRFNIQKVLA